MILKKYSMHRNDDSVFLLYIEPKKEDKLKEPIEDEVTHIMEKAFAHSCGQLKFHIYL